MFSEPVTGEKFFGREEVLELLNKRVSALKDGYRQNVALTGQSLSGKSSIILHFLHTVKDEAFVPVYVEVVKEPLRSFANKFVATMLYNVLTKKGEDVSIDMGSLLERTSKTIPRTAAAIKNINASIDRGDTDEAYSNLLALTSVLKEETGLSCIVILDEFDNLEHVGVKNPFLNFGRVIMVQKDTMYIVSSSRDSAIKKIISEKLSLLFGNFEVVKIHNFDVGTSNAFLDSKLAGFDMEGSLRIFLISITEGNPFYLDKLATHARSAAMERMSSYIDADMVSKAVVDLVFDSGGAIHQYLSNFLLEVLETKCREPYMAILTAIANGYNRQALMAKPLKMKQGETSKALARLADIGLISKNGVFYRIDDAMLEFWLKSVYQRRRDILVGGTFDRMALFAEDVKAFISAFEKDLCREIPSRIAELFSQFSNELVSIDSKQMKLPHFTRTEIRASTDSKTFISSSFRSKYWIVQAYEERVTENDILSYVRNAKALGRKVSNKIIIPLKGIDENAMLIAKELKISIWESPVINTLLGLYGKRKIYIL